MTSRERRFKNPGRREREAGKRHRRAWVLEEGNCTVNANHSYFLRWPPENGGKPLRLGRKHFSRWMRRHLAVADS